MMSHAGIKDVALFILSKYFCPLVDLDAFWLQFLPRPPSALGAMVFPHPVRAMWVDGSGILGAPRLCDVRALCLVHR
jgi:hypothetical protein